MSGNKGKGEFLNVEWEKLFFPCIVMPIILFRESQTHSPMVSCVGKKNIFKAPESIHISKPDFIKCN